MEKRCESDKRMLKETRDCSRNRQWKAGLCGRLTDPTGYGFDRRGVGQSSAMSLSQFVPAHGAIYAIFFLVVLNGQICFCDNLA